MTTLRSEGRGRAGAGAARKRWNRFATSSHLAPRRPERAQPDRVSRRPPMHLARFARPAFLIGLAVPASASTWIVDDTPGPGVDFATIAAAEAVSVAGDVILVRPATTPGSRSTSASRSSATRARRSRALADDPEACPPDRGRRSPGSRRAASACRRATRRCCSRISSSRRRTRRNSPTRSRSSRSSAAPTSACAAWTCRRRCRVVRRSRSTASRSLRARGAVAVQLERRTRISCTNYLHEVSAGTRR